MTTLSRVALVTGASSGFGQATAALLAAQGFQVFGTSRAPVHNTSSGFELLPLDVCSETSVHTCVQTILERTGRIDLLVNNAGFVQGGALEENSLEDARAQFETNVFGVLRMLKAVLPVIRQQGSGQIVTVSSILGVVMMPSTSSAPPLRSYVGPRASLLVALRHWLPQRIFEQVRRRVFQIQRVPGFDGKAQPVRN